MLRRLMVVLALLTAGLTTSAGPALAATACHGSPLTQRSGTAGRDVILGTSGADVINGGGGNDVIYGRGGNDLICGGSGNDVIDGMLGQDVVYGGTGTDYCVAPTAAEHQLHHGCEVHLGAPVNGAPPSQSTASRASGGAPIANSSTLPAAPNLRIGAATTYSECPAGACSVGQPICSGLVSPAQIDIADGQPTAYNYFDQGSIAVAVEIDYLDESNFTHLQYGSTSATVYNSLNAGTTYYVPPNDGLVNVGAGVSYAVYMWFAWYDPASQNWTNWYWEGATQYRNGGIGDTGSCFTFGG